VPAAALLASLAAACLAAYGLACWQAPYGTCRCQHADPLCRHCNGTGRRVRIGRRAFNYLRRLYEPPTQRGDPMPERPVTAALLAVATILAAIVICLVLAVALHLTPSHAATTPTPTTTSSPAADPAPAPGEYIPTPAGPPATTAHQGQP